MVKNRKSHQPCQSSEREKYTSHRLGECVPDMHHQGKIRYGANPRPVHDRELDVDRLHRHRVDHCGRGGASDEADSGGFVMVSRSFVST
jgi:hypothetical protein